MILFAFLILTLGWRTARLVQREALHPTPALPAAARSLLQHPIAADKVLPRPAVRAASRARSVTALAGEIPRRVVVSAELTDDKVENLFAWVRCALTGDPRYNNLVLAFACIFGEQQGDAGSSCAVMIEAAKQQLMQAPEDVPVGDPDSLRERERASLGAMGAGQWSGQFRTRPHALLDVRAFESVEDWVRSLPRGARRTLKKAAGARTSVVRRTIRGGEPAPHSTRAHFRCVLEHEVRLLAGAGTDGEDFFAALSQAVGRYVNSVSQAGEIVEYLDEDGRVIAFAHEVQKGRVVRGQWFYATDAAAKRYVWFDSVRNLVERAVATDSVDTVDLGPSGSDDFTALKERYGFKDIRDWHVVADYRGPFEYWPGGERGYSWAELDPPDWLFNTDWASSLRRQLAGLEEEEELE